MNKNIDMVKKTLHVNNTEGKELVSIYDYCKEHKLKSIDVIKVIKYINPKANKPTARVDCDLLDFYLFFTGVKDSTGFSRPEQIAFSKYPSEFKLTTGCWIEQKLRYQYNECNNEQILERLSEELIKRYYKYLISIFRPSISYQGKYFSIYNGNKKYIFNKVDKDRYMYNNKIYTFYDGDIIHFIMSYKNKRVHLNVKKTKQKKKNPFIIIQRRFILPKQTIYLE